MNLTGQKFGRLTVIEVEPAEETRWRCLCECGKERVTSGRNLVAGLSESCGCLHQERLEATRRKHGHNTRKATSRTYRSWSQMKQRCQNPKNPRWDCYGGRGIKVCARWQAFLPFLADMGERPAGLTLERKNNDGNYEPGNCKWATIQEQRDNQRGRRVFVEVDGNVMRAAAASRLFSIKGFLFYRWIKKHGAKKAVEKAKRYAVSRS